MIRQAVILAGGQGTRLGELTRQIAKPVIEVAGEPFLGHLLWNLGRQGIRDLVLAVGHRHETVRAAIGAGHRWGVKVDYVLETQPLGTGGGLRHCAPLLQDEFLVLNGDSLFDINYLDLALQLKKGQEGALALRWLEDSGRYGAVRLQGETIRGFAEKGGRGAGAINGGVYVCRRSLLDRLPEGPSSLERDLFPGLAAKGTLGGKVYQGMFIDIGVPEDLARSQELLAAWRRKAAVFFDRDGVINIDHGYVHTPENFHWIQGAIEAVKLANDLGYLAILITNQAGIARGYYEEAAFRSLMDWVEEELRRHGAHFDAVYFCPHHPTAGQGEYRIQCDCRKPAPGLILRAAREWSIELENSFFIGDKESDLAAARAAEVAPVLFTDQHNLLALIEPYLRR